jgi:hypothetical protein
VKMRVIQYGDKTFDLDDEYAGPAIAAAISGESGEGIRSEVIDYTDTERSDIDRDEYAIVTGDDGNVLWQGWLDSDKDDVPPPAGAVQDDDDAPEPGLIAPELAAVLAAIDKFEAGLGFTAPELTGMRIGELRDRVRDVFEPDEDDAEGDDDEDGDGPGGGDWQQQRAADAAYWGSGQ